MLLTISALLAFSPVPSLVEAQEVPRLVCHPLLRGVPSRSPTIYTIEGDGLYAESEVGKHRISTEGEVLPLDRVREASGSFTRTFASHARDGDVIERTVYWQPDGQPRAPRFTERFDFAGRTIIRQGEGDSCHADAYANGNR